MIKTKNGKIEADGTIGELVSDLFVITFCMYNDILQDELSEEEAKEIIFNTMNKAVKSEEELKGQGEE